MREIRTASIVALALGCALLLAWGSESSSLPAGAAGTSADRATEGAAAGPSGDDGQKCEEGVASLQRKPLTENAGRVDNDPWLCEAPLMAGVPWVDGRIGVTTAHGAQR